MNMKLLIPSALVLATAGLTISFDRPTTRVDGTPLPQSEIKEYAAYINGVEHPSRIPGSTSGADYPTLSYGCFKLRTIDTDGRWSEYSDEVCKGSSTTTTTVDPNITSTTTTLSSSSTSSSTSPSTTTTTGISLQPPAIFSNKIYKTRIISTAGYYLPYPYIENCDLAFMWAGPFADELDLDESAHIIAVRTSYSSEGTGVCRALNYFTFDGGLIIGDAYNPGLVITHMVGFSTGLTMHAIGLVGNQEAMITGVALLFGIYDSDVLTPY